MKLRQVGQSRGFTIVELLIVVVVIAVLAAITVVAYNGITNRAKTAGVQSAASSAAKKIEVLALQNAEMYPDSFSETGIANSSTTTYLYSSDNIASPRLYCVTAMNGDISSYVSTTSGGVKSGVCPGHWDKSKGYAAAPISGATYDTTVFRTSTGSMRYGPSGTGSFNIGPFTGSQGQTLIIGFWMRTDANWDGTISNSKIRIGNASGGALVASCPYDGPKVSWTFVSCTFTFGSSIPSVHVTVRNDGTTGMIWIDDVSLSLPN